MDSHQAKLKAELGQLLQLPARFRAVWEAGAVAAPLDVNRGAWAVWLWQQRRRRGSCHAYTG